MNFRNFYRHPRETYRCGLSTAGRTCTHGPNGKQCGQSQKIPERCTPIRTLLGWSRLTSWMCTIVAILTMSYWFLFPKNNLPLAPGNLSKAHAQLLVKGLSDHPLSIDDEKRCAACHPNAISNPANKLASTDPGYSIPAQLASARKQSELCMNCHSDTMPNGLLGNPHDLVGDELSALLASVSDRHPKKLALEPTECSQCHREHQGSDGDLQAITSAKCQACHRNQFQSFAEGHPEFESYPPNKPRSIGFDHARHAELHFSKKGKSFQCNDCHLQSQQSGLVGSVFRSVSFEQACADCHNDSLKSAGIEGLVVFQIPSVDRTKLLKHGHDIGPWPESASLMMDGDLTPLLTHMLRSSEEGRAILSQLPKSGRLKDVNLDDPNQSRAIADLTRFVRERWNEISSDGQPMLKKWMEMGTTASSIAATTNLPPGLDLYARFVSSRSSNDLPAQPTINVTSDKNVVKEDWANQLATGIPPDLLRSASQKWFRQEPKTSVTAVPTTHDERLPVIMNLIPARVDHSDRITQPKPNERNVGEIQPPSPVISPTSLRFEPIVALSSSQDDDDLLTGQEDNLLLGPNSKTTPLMDQDDDLTSDDDLLLGTEQNNLSTHGNDSGVVSDVNKPLKPWEHLPYGGWMIDDNRVALVYVPVGHADPWVSRWIEWNLLVRSEPDTPDLQDPFLKQCIQCHSFDRHRVQQMLNPTRDSEQRNATENGMRAVKHTNREDINEYCWKIDQRPNARRELTKFNHTPHLSINSLRDCQSCHKLKKLNDQQLTEQGWSDRGRTLRSEFVPLEKHQCASCHTTRSAGDACTQCHNYHVHGLFQDH
jgi:predicted Zn-ribbon and HTH transcriptional regulator